MRRCITAAVLLASMSTLACSRAGDAQARGKTDPPRPVKTVAVRQDDIRRAIDIVGTLAAADEVTVSAEVEGKVSRILADLGDRVAAGQVLVELDREKLEYRYQASKAALERALAKYGADGTGADTLVPLEKTPDVQKAAADLAQAEQAVTRARELTKRSLLPEQQLDDAEARYQAAKASYDAALQGAKNLRADVDAEQANLRLAERELRDGLIRAPFDGYVQKRLVAPGLFVRVQTPVMSLVRVNPLKLTGEVPERMAPWVKVGQPVEVRVDAYPDRAISGTITRLSPAVNEQTRAFPLEATVPNTDNALKPGTFARARIVSDRVDRVLAVPVAALQYRYGVNRVFVVNRDRLISREVKLGDRLGDRVEVVAGLQAGDLIVVEDVEQLADGLLVTAARGE
jgi:multidrug efflux pump subunit AcrA (membrane-fusion protein)